MKANDVFPGSYLRSEDIDGHQPVVTIKEVKTEELGDSNKPVVYFEGKERGVVLNKTNWSALVDITGEEDSDDWPGHRIMLVVRKVDYQGKRVPAIRIEAPPAATTKAAKAKPQPEPAVADEIGIDEIPFVSLLPLLLPALAACSWMVA